MPTVDAIEKQRQESVKKLAAYINEHGPRVVLVGLNHNPSTKASGRASTPLMTCVKADNVHTFGATYVIPTHDEKVKSRVMAFRAEPTAENLAYVCKRVYDLDGIHLDWL